MNKIREIHLELQRRYAAQSPAELHVPLAIQAIELRSFARQYLKAAALVAAGSPDIWLVHLQLIGQGTELAMKACLASAGVPPPRAPKGHDLVHLYCLAAREGFELSEFEQACLVHLDHLYHRDLATKTKFKTRYPADTDESLGGSVPDAVVLQAITESLCEQSEQRGNHA
jgi:HEPN domain-containing protein